MSIVLISGDRANAAKPAAGEWCQAPGGGGTPINYLYGYVPPNGVGILTHLI